MTKATVRQVAWLLDPEVIKYSEQRHHAHSLKSQLRWLDSFSGKSHVWGIYLAANGDHIGNLTARHDRYNDVTDVGIMIGEGKCRGLRSGLRSLEGRRALAARPELRQVPQAGSRLHARERADAQDPAGDEDLAGRHLAPAEHLGPGARELDLSDRGRSLTVLQLEGAFRQFEHGAAERNGAGGDDEHIPMASVQGGEIVGERIEPSPLDRPGRLVDEQRRADLDDDAPETLQRRQGGHGRSSPSERGIVPSEHVGPAAAASGFKVAIPSAFAA